MLILSRDQFNQAMIKYKKLVNELPDHLTCKCPIIEDFLTPYTDYTSSTKYYDSAYHVITDQTRYDILMSPHATALFRLWVLFGDKPDD